MGRADGAGEAWKVAPAYAVVEAVDIGFAEDGISPDGAPVNGGVLQPVRAAAGDVRTFLYRFLLRDFCLDPVSVVRIWEGWSFLRGVLGGVFRLS